MDKKNINKPCNQSEYSASYGLFFENLIFPKIKQKLKKFTFSKIGPYPTFTFIGWVFYAFFCAMEPSFTWALKKVWIGLAILIFLAYLRHPLLYKISDSKSECTSDTKKSMFSNQIKNLNSTPIKLSSMAEKT